MSGDRVPTPPCRPLARMLLARGSAAQLRGRCRGRVRGHGCEIKAHPPAQLLFLNSKQTGGLDSLFPGLVLHIITLLFLLLLFWMGSHSVQGTGWTLMMQSGLALSLQEFLCLGLPNARLAGVITPNQVLISIYAL